MIIFNQNKNTKKKTTNPPKSSFVHHSINTNHHNNNHSSQIHLHSPLTFTTPVPETIANTHTHAIGPNQCCSAVVKQISAPISTVWSVVRRFDNPQAYKHFLKSCQVIFGDGKAGALREIHAVSGFPAANSTERLDLLDDESYVMSFSVVGGDNRLSNYRSFTTLHPSPSGNGTVVVESYVVDIPPGNSWEDTCVFVDTIIRCNLQSLAKMSEKLASRVRS